MNFHETLCSSGIPWMNLIYDLMALELLIKECDISKEQCFEV